MTVVVQEDKSAVVEIFKSITDVIPLMKVCNASPTPAGRRIQARITWPENGKTVIGYTSQWPGGLPLSLQMVIADIFRIRERATKHVNANLTATTQYQTYSRINAIEIDVINQINDLIIAPTPRTVLYTKIEAVTNEINRKIAAVATAGLQHVNSREHLKKQGRKALSKCLDKILEVGLNEDEIQELLKEAQVRAVHST